MTTDKTIFTLSIPDYMTPEQFFAICQEERIDEVIDIDRRPYYRRSKGDDAILFKSPAALKEIQSFLSSYPEDTDAVRLLNDINNEKEPISELRDRLEQVALAHRNDMASKTILDYLENPVNEKGLSKKRFNSSELKTFLTNSNRANRTNITYSHREHLGFDAPPRRTRETDRLLTSGAIDPAKYEQWSPFLAQLSELKRKTENGKRVLLITRNNDFSSAPSRLQIAQALERFSPELYHGAVGNLNMSESTQRLECVDTKTLLGRVVKPYYPVDEDNYLRYCLHSRPFKFAGPDTPVSFIGSAIKPLITYTAPSTILNNPNYGIAPQEEVCEGPYGKGRWETVFGRQLKEAFQKGTKGSTVFLSFDFSNKTTPNEYIQEVIKQSNRGAATDENGFYQYSRFINIRIPHSPEAMDKFNYERAVEKLVAVIDKVRQTSPDGKVSLVITGANEAQLEAQRRIDIDSNAYVNLDSTAQSVMRKHHFSGSVDSLLDDSGLNDERVQAFVQEFFSIFLSRTFAVQNEDAEFGLDYTPAKEIINSTIIAMNSGVPQAAAEALQKEQITPHLVYAPNFAMTTPTGDGTDPRGVDLVGEPAYAMMHNPLNLGKMSVSQEKLSDIALNEVNELRERSERHFNEGTPGFSELAFLAIKSLQDNATKHSPVFIDDVTAMRMHDAAVKQSVCIATPETLFDALTSLTYETQNGEYETVCPPFYGKEISLKRIKDAFKQADALLTTNAEQYQTYPITYASPYYPENLRKFHTIEQEGRVSSEMIGHYSIDQLISKMNEEMMNVDADSSLTAAQKRDMKQEIRFKYRDMPDYRNYSAAIDTAKAVSATPVFWAKGMPDALTKESVSVFSPDLTHNGENTTLLLQRVQEFANELTDDAQYARQLVTTSSGRRKLAPARAKTPAPQMRTDIMDAVIESNRPIHVALDTLTPEERRDRFNRSRFLAENMTDIITQANALEHKVNLNALSQALSYTIDTLVQREDHLLSPEVQEMVLKRLEKHDITLNSLENDNAAHKNYIPERKAVLTDADTRTQILLLFHENERLNLEDASELAIAIADHQAELQVLSHDDGDKTADEIRFEQIEEQYNAAIRFIDETERTSLEKEEQRLQDMEAGLRQLYADQAFIEPDDILSIDDSRKRIAQAEDAIKQKKQDIESLSEDAERKRQDASAAYEESRNELINQNGEREAARRERISTLNEMLETETTKYNELMSQMNDSQMRYLLFSSLASISDQLDELQQRYNDMSSEGGLFTRDKGITMADDILNLQKQYETEVLPLVNTLIAEQPVKIIKTKDGETKVDFDKKQALISPDKKVATDAASLYANIRNVSALLLTLTNSVNQYKGMKAGQADMADLDFLRSDEAVRLYNSIFNIISPGIDRIANTPGTENYIPVRLMKKAADNIRKRADGNDVLYAPNEVASLALSRERQVVAFVEQMPRGEERTADLITLKGGVLMSSVAPGKGDYEIAPLKEKDYEGNRVATAPTKTTKDFANLKDIVEKNYEKEQQEKDLKAMERAEKLRTKRGANRGRALLGASNVVNDAFHNVEGVDYAISLANLASTVAVVGINALVNKLKKDDKKDIVPGSFHLDVIKAGEPHNPASPTQPDIVIAPRDAEKGETLRAVREQYKGKPFILLFGKDKKEYIDALRQGFSVNPDGTINRPSEQEMAALRELSIGAHAIEPEPITSRLLYNKNKETGAVSLSAVNDGPEVILEHDTLVYEHLREKVKAIQEEYYAAVGLEGYTQQHIADSLYPVLTRDSIEMRFGTETVMRIDLDRAGRLRVTQNDPTLSLSGDHGLNWTNIVDKYNGIINIHKTESLEDVIAGNQEFIDTVTNGIHNRLFHETITGLRPDPNMTEEQVKQQQDLVKVKNCVGEQLDLVKSTNIDNAIKAVKLGAKRDYSITPAILTDRSASTTLEEIERLVERKATLDIDYGTTLTDHDGIAEAVNNFNDSAHKRPVDASELRLYYDEVKNLLSETGPALESFDAVQEWLDDAHEVTLVAERYAAQSDRKKLSRELILSSQILEHLQESERINAEAQDIKNNRDRNTNGEIVSRIALAEEYAVAHAVQNERLAEYIDHARKVLTASPRNVPQIRKAIDSLSMFLAHDKTISSSDRELATGYISSVNKILPLCDTYTQQTEQLRQANASLEEELTRARIIDNIRINEKNSNDAGYYIKERVSKDDPITLVYDQAEITYTTSRYISEAQVYGFALEAAKYFQKHPELPESEVLKNYYTSLAENIEKGSVADLRIDAEQGILVAMPCQDDIVPEGDSRTQKYEYYPLLHENYSNFSTDDILNPDVIKKNAELLAKAREEKGIQEIKQTSSSLTTEKAIELAQLYRTFQLNTPQQTANKMRQQSREEAVRNVVTEDDVLHILERELDGAKIPVAKLVRVGDNYAIANLQNVVISEEFVDYDAIGEDNTPDVFDDSIGIYFASTDESSPMQYFDLKNLQPTTSQRITSKEATSHPDWELGRLEDGSAIMVCTYENAILFEGKHFKDVVPAGISNNEESQLFICTSNGRNFSIIDKAGTNLSYAYLKDKEMFCNKIDQPDNLGFLRMYCTSKPDANGNRQRENFYLDSTTGEILTQAEYTRHKQSMGGGKGIQLTPAS